MLGRVISVSVAASLSAIALSSSAFAVDLPPIKLAADNRVPACVTPGRLMALIKARTPDLDPRFSTIAVDYARHGEELGLRWDFAFFQMVVETGGLSYRNGSRSGAVKPQQNNFAGIGAAGNGELPESFADVPAGVRAHLQHVLLYAGERIEQPVAERTRKVQQWGVLTAWQQTVKGPITFADLAGRWAATKSYSQQIASVAARFNEHHCHKPDPQPELLAALRGPAVAGAVAPEPKVDAKAEPKDEKVSGAGLAQKAIADGKAEQENRRFMLGGSGLAKAAPQVKILNAPKEEAAAIAVAPETPAATSPAAVAAKATAAKPPVPSAPSHSASAPVTAAAATKPVTAAKPDTVPTKCRVWTASYGGARALIIRSIQDSTTNITVLDVNAGQETREAEAYISAYAKGGSVAGEFANQTLALDKAFELCPEG